jgi:ribosome-binding protein aMBF1 (putative translation factor)
MEECYKCGISSERKRLFEVISDEGLVEMCEKCIEEEGLPIVRKPTTFQLKEAERKRTVYQRLAKASGFDVNKMKKDFSKKIKQKDVSLKDLADKNFNKGFGKGHKPRKDLIDNFHWKIMRSRRLKHISRAKLAEKIGESEAVINMAEKGVFPEDDYRIINKLESFLGIKIVKKEYQEIAKQQKEFDPRKFNVSSSDTRNIKLRDLKKAKSDSAGKEPYWKTRINGILEKEKKLRNSPNDSKSLENEIQEKSLKEDLREIDFKKGDFNSEKETDKENKGEFGDIEGEKISSKKIEKESDNSLENNDSPVSEEKKNEKTRENFTQEDMNDIIFGGK